MWILVILLLTPGGAVESIDKTEGFQTEVSCRTAAAAIEGASRSPRNIATVCIEQTWEGDAYGGLGQ